MHPLAEASMLHGELQESDIESMRPGMTEVRKRSVDDPVPCDGCSMRKLCAAGCPLTGRHVACGDYVHWVRTGERLAGRLSNRAVSHDLFEQAMAS